MFIKIISFIVFFIASLFLIVVTVIGIPYKQTIDWENEVYKNTEFYLLTDNKTEIYNKTCLNNLKVYHVVKKGYCLYPFDSVSYFLRKTADEDKVNLQNSKSGSIARYNHGFIMILIGAFIAFFSSIIVLANNLKNKTRS